MFENPSVRQRPLSVSVSPEKRNSPLNIASNVALIDFCASRILRSAQQPIEDADDLDVTRTTSFESAAGADVAVLGFPAGVPPAVVVSALEGLGVILPGTAKVVLSEANDSGLAKAALKAGASGYVAATMPRHALLHAVRSVLAGEACFPPAALEDLRSPEALDESATLERCKLSPRQREVYALMCRGLPNKLIAHELGMREGTAKVHVRQIMQKLGVSNRTQAVRAAFVGPSGRA